MLTANRKRRSDWLHPFYRVMTRVQFTPNGCWEFTGSKLRGYGMVRNDLMSDYVHRIVYQVIVGEVPDGLDLDHLCRNRACCNPDHLEPVTRSENLRRGFAAEVHPDVARKRAQTHCKRGHELSGENLYQVGARRHCRACWKVRASC